MFHTTDLINNTSDKDLYNINFSYPNQNDEHLQSKLLIKKELYNYHSKHIPNLIKYADLKLYREQKCLNKNFSLSEQQIMLTNFFNVNSTQKGLLLFHGLGTGKTCTAISIAETFKQQCLHYNTKIIILVPGPTLKKNWMNELVKCTGTTYQPSIKSQTEKQINNTSYDYLEFYKIMSYKSFNKKVLGERIKNIDTSKKQKYQKDEKGEYVRKENPNKIDKLDNTLLIVDEAHNITGNTTYESIKKIMNNSKNLKLLLLTGTPMKNEATDIIDLINLLKPKDKQIKKSQIFNINDFTDNLNFTENGKEILRNSIKGIVSYFKSNDPYIFALQHDMGIVPKSLKFTKIIPCKLSKFHNQLYQEITKKLNNKIEETTNSVVNFVLPYNDDNKIIPIYGADGYDRVISELRHNENKFNLYLQKFLQDTTKLKDIPNNRLIYLNNDGHITGNFLHENFLYIFSIKFAQALKNLNELIYDKKGVKTAFIYSNLVKYGINMFKQVLLQNGYLEFKENTKKTLEYVPEYIKCYFCGKILKDHNNIKNHEYYPACFITVTGGENQFETEYNNDNSAEEIISKVFCDPDNSTGKYIKFVLGSRVLSEGFNLKNVGEVHILDTWFNFTRIEQTIGRGIRRCSHMDVINENNMYPVVNVYKYCVVDEPEISSEEKIYKRAEKKHILIKEIEHIIKENALDCPLNYESNKIFNAEKYKKCIPLTIDNYDTIQLNKNEEFCPVNCDYQKCEIKCKDNKLDEFYDKPTDNFNVPENKIDNNTYESNVNIDLSKYKQKIKNLFILKYIYTLDELIKEFNINEFEHFDLYYFYRALDEFIPHNENEMNNYNEDLVDKYNRPGYLLYLNKFYIFQPFGISENEIMKYKITQNININENISLYEFMNHNNMITNIIKQTNEVINYDFDTYKSYYLNKKEFNYVGIIDKEPNKKKTKSDNELKDIFRLRERITKKTDKKRETGLQTYIGSVCFNSYNMNYIKKVFQTLKIPFDSKLSRIELCQQVQDKLYELEKYNNDGYTYLIIPSNHPTIPFPLNLKDRVEFIKDKVKDKIKNNIVFSVDKKEKDKKKYYILHIKKDKNIKDYDNFLKDLGFKETKDNFEIIID